MSTKLDKIHDEILDLKHRMTTLEAGESGHYASVAARLDRIEVRLDRIEPSL
jgi:hypothetical protein